MKNHIHYATYVSYYEPIDVINCLAEYMNINPERHEWGRHTYRTHYSFGTEANVYFSSNRDDVCIELKGSACERLGTAKVLDLLDLFESKCTRLDLAVDHCLFTPLDVKKHINLQYDSEVTNVRTKVKRTSFAWFENYHGQTVTIGSRSSTRYARIYNRNKDENGENYTRFELELRKKSAHKVARLLADNRDELGKNMVGVIRDFIDFTDGTQSNNSRSKLAKFWLVFIDSCEKACLKYTDVVSTNLEKVCKHMRSLGPSLMVYLCAHVSKREITFEKALFDLLNDSFPRLKPKHKELINYANNTDLSRLVL